VWENSWLVATLFMYLLLPLAEARFFVPDFVQIFRAANPRDFWMIYFFGLIQGTGGLAFTYGIVLMGLSLGYSLMISLIFVTGTMVPLVLGHPDQIPTVGGITLILGVLILIAGVALCAKAGRLRELAAGAGTRIRSYALVIFIILYSGIANSFFYFSLEFQKNLKAAAITQFGVKEALWPVLNVIPLFAGMFTINLVYCLFRMAKTGTFKNYWCGTRLGVEYLLAAAIGIAWFLGQGVCYAVGFTMLGSLGVPVGAAVFMGVMIVVSNVLGLKTGEWKQAEPRIMRLMYAGIILEILAVTIVGVGNHFMLQQ
jgi:L-rhamnose-H+ transport protein